MFEQSKQSRHAKATDMTDMIQRFIGTAALGTAMGVAVGGGCKFDNAKDHCAYADGNDYCGQKYGGEERRYCARGNHACQDRFPAEDHDGCVDARPDDAACYSPCGDGKSAIDDPQCEGVADGSSSSVSASATEATTEPTGGPTTAGSGSMSNSGSETESASSSTTDSGCTLSLECTDPANPICIDMACVPCSSDDECLAKSADAPACTDDGRCVACTPSNASACTDTTPVCNAANNECEGCDFHEQCASSACELGTGACFDGACVVQVDADGPGDETTVSAAIADGCVVVVHAAAGGYPESVEIDGAITVAILAAPGESPTVLGEGANGLPGFDVSAGATVYMQGLDVSGNDGGGLGIVVDGASVWLDRTMVGNNDGGGIALSGGADGHLRNCFVGGDVNNVAALEANSSTVDILYSTLGSGFGTAAALRCNLAATVNVRNSLLVASTDDPEVDCATDSLATSATEADLGDMNTNWFVAGGFAVGDFHLSASAPAGLLNAAQWNAGDPPTDIDGELRPSNPGASDVAGADVP